MSKVSHTTFTVPQPIASNQSGSRSSHQKSISASIIMKNNYASLPLSKRRKVIFLYHSLQSSGPSFQWACEHVFRPGKDYVTLLYASTDETYQIVDPKKLWQIANDEISVEVEQKKKLDRVEQELEILRLSLVEMDIIAQKVLMAEGDSKSNIIKLSYSINSELIVLSSNLISGLQKAVYGGLEEYLMKNSECSVLVVKPKPGSIARRDSGVSSNLSSPTYRSLPLRNNGTQTGEGDSPELANGTSNFEIGLTSPPEPVTLDINYRGNASKDTPTDPNLPQNKDLLSPKLESGSEDETNSIPQSTGDYNEVDGVLVSMATLDALKHEPEQEQGEEVDDNNPIVNFQKHLGESVEPYTTAKDDDPFGYNMGPELPSIPEPVQTTTPHNELEETVAQGEPVGFTVEPESVVQPVEAELATPLPNPDVLAAAQQDHYSSSDESGPEVSEDPIRNNKKLIKKATKANAAATAFLARTNSVSGSTNSAMFKPPQPQPKVKSIIQKIPNLDEEEAANEKLGL